MIGKGCADEKHAQVTFHTDASGDDVLCSCWSTLACNHRLLIDDCVRAITEVNDFSCYFYRGLFSGIRFVRRSFRRALFGNGAPILFFYIGGDAFAIFEWTKRALGYGELSIDGDAPDFRFAQKMIVFACAIDVGKERQLTISGSKHRLRKNFVRQAGFAFLWHAKHHAIIATRRDTFFELCDDRLGQVLTIHDRHGIFQGEFWVCLNESFEMGTTRDRQFHALGLHRATLLR